MQQIKNRTPRNPFIHQQKTAQTLMFRRFSLRGMGGNRTHGEAFAEPCLTTWLPRRNLKSLKQSYLVRLIKQKIKASLKKLLLFKSAFFALPSTLQINWLA